jgi:hypothetical protein
MKIFSRKFYWKASYIMRIKGERNSNSSRMSVCASKDFRIKKSGNKRKESNYPVSWKCWTYYGRAIM